MRALALQAPLTTSLGKWAVYVSNYISIHAPLLLATETPPATQWFSPELKVKLDLNFDQ